MTISIQELSAGTKPVEGEGLRERKPPLNFEGPPHLKTEMGEEEEKELFPEQPHHHQELEMLTSP